MTTFIERHHRPGKGNVMGRSKSLGFFIRVQQQDLMATDGRKLSAGPGNRDATRDEARRHLAWLKNQQYLSQLADFRAAQLEGAK